MYFLVFVFAATSMVGASTTNPLGTVIELMDSLAAKIIKEGEVEAKAYNDYFEWCDDFSKNANFGIDTATAKKGKLEALIAKTTDDSEASAGKIEELAGSIAADEDELNKAT